MSLIPLIAAALAQELKERDIAALGWPVCEDIIRGVLERTSDAARRRLEASDKEGGSPDQGTPA